jgi:hypothetical protein
MESRRGSGRIHAGQRDSMVTQLPAEDSVVRCQVQSPAGACK